MVVDYVAVNTSAKGEVGQQQQVFLILILILLLSARSQSYIFFNHFRVIFGFIFEFEIARIDRSRTEKWTINRKMTNAPTSDRVGRQK